MSNKNYIVTFSVVIFALLLLFPVGILSLGEVTPSEVLSSKPYIEVANTIIIVPSSTIIVYFLGIITIVIGVKLLKLEEKYQRYWGISLILWGIGTILAGTSYQGLGYELKCSERAICMFTSWFELAYLYVTALSITIMGYAVVMKSYTKSRQVKMNNIFKSIFLMYCFILVIGVITETYILITYEMFLVFFTPMFLVFFFINLRNNKEQKNPLDKGLVHVWIIMLIVNVMYFGYLFSGIPEALYENYNIWFSANDVLHVGLIPWMIYIYIVVKRKKTITSN